MNLRLKVTIDYFEKSLGETPARFAWKIYSLNIGKSCSKGVPEERTHASCQGGVDTPREQRCSLGIFVSIFVDIRDISCDLKV